MQEGAECVKVQHKNAYEFMDWGGRSNWLFKYMKGKSQKMESKWKAGQLS